jgi:hypothetical protein
MTPETKKPASLTRMSRAQIAQGLDQIPVGVLLTGTGKKSQLTAKQKTFAHQVALGDTKADAYRKAYKSKGTARTAGNNGSKLAKHTGIALEVEAIQAALEATKYQNAGQIKALVVHQLTQHALNEDNPPAQRIKALELLGRTHEVGLFVESKQVTQVHSSVDIKSRLMEQLKTFIRADVEDVEDKGADSLMAELSGVPLDARADEVPADPPPPEIDRFVSQPATHSNMLTRSTPESDPLTRSQSESTPTSGKSYNNHSQVVDSIEEKNVTLNVYSENGGVGGVKISQSVEDLATETPPVIDSGSPAMPTDEDYLAALGPCGK